MLKDKKSVFLISVAIIIVFLLDISWFGEKLYDLIQFYEKVILPLYFSFISIIHDYGNVLYIVAKFFAVILLISYMYDRYRNISDDVMKIHNRIDKYKYFLKLLYGILTKLIKVLTAQLFFIYTIIHTHGNASTGYNLDELHGIALRNAIVAYFGGGAKNTGGGGKEFGYKVILLIFVYFILSKFIIGKIKQVVNYLKKRFN